MSYFLKFKLKYHLQNNINHRHNCNVTLLQNKVIHKTYAPAYHQDKPEPTYNQF
jgi:hypothetical protein